MPFVPSKQPEHPFEFRSWPPRSFPRRGCGFHFQNYFDGEKSGRDARFPGISMPQVFRPHVSFRKKELSKLPVPFCSQKQLSAVVHGPVDWEVLLSPGDPANAHIKDGIEVSRHQQMSERPLPMCSNISEPCKYLLYLPFQIARELFLLIDLYNPERMVQEPLLDGRSSDDGFQQRAVHSAQAREISLFDP